MDEWTSDRGMDDTGLYFMYVYILGTYVYKISNFGWMDGWAH